MRIANSALVLGISLLAACSNDSADEIQRPPANQAPIVSAIAATVATANRSSQPIAFSVSDEDADALLISAMSDRPEIVPTDGIVVAGAGQQRTLTITPVVDMTGDAMITVIAEDEEGLAASASFLLTVAAEQRSMQQFVRDTFSDADSDEPALINAVEFTQDADDDDFADLLEQ